MNDTTCHDAQVAFEMRRYGALDAAGIARLEEHLGSCEVCQGVVAETTRIEELMRTTTATVMEQIDWQGVHARFEAHRAQLRRMPWRIGLGLAAMVVVDLVLRAIGIGGVNVGGYAGVMALLVVTHRSLRRRADDVRTQADMLAHGRAELDRRITQARRSLWLGPTVAVVVGAMSLYLVWTGESTIYLGLAAFLALMLAVEVIVNVRRLPALVRERAELD